MAKNSWFNSTMMEYFPESYAQRGLAYTAAQNTRSGAFSAAFSPMSTWRNRPGTSNFERNFAQIEQELTAKHGGTLPTKLKEKLAKTQATHLGAKANPIGYGAKRMAWGFAGGVAGVGFIGYGGYASFRDTQGSVGDKSAAAGISLVADTAGTAATFLGGKVGAAIGTAIAPGIGTVIGAGVGAISGYLGTYMGLSSAGYAAYGFANRLVDNERRRRGIEWNGWAGQTQVFNTQKAATMRQRSLEAMNRGMMNARSAMGREASFMHR